jgi:ankyrin repeat protein
MDLVGAIAGREDIKIIEQLIQGGADVNAADSLGFRPLCEAANKGSIQIVQLLIHYGADVNLSDERGISPLHWACSNGNPEVVKLLIQKGAHVNSVDKKGFTPAHNTFQHDYYAAFIQLIRAGVDLNLQTENGNDVHTVADFYPYSICNLILKKIDMLKSEGKDASIESFLKEIESTMKQYEIERQSRRYRSWLETRISPLRIKDIWEKYLPQQNPYETNDNILEF